MNVEITNGATKNSFLNKIKKWWLRLLRLTDAPTVKLYTGYGNKADCFLYGHVFSFGPLPRKRYRRLFWVNTLALLRLFMVKPIAGALLKFSWEEKNYTTVSEKDGFFKFEWKPATVLQPGEYEVEVFLCDPVNNAPVSAAKAKIIIPHVNQYTFISDIDDTFLISHSANLRKRLYVLFTENARSRKPFEGVVNHYQLLASANTKAATSNPFFFVSSSEWNLYDYIKEFSSINKLPDGVYLLNQLKLFKQVFKTGHNNHKTKFMRIIRVMEAYPQQQFILLGDDSQEDPFIYASLVAHFPGRIFCIYIRCVNNTKENVEDKLKEVVAAGAYCCYFRHSSEAVAHSRSIGLITQAG